ncbi:hypothetical protein BVRB_3g058320 isoform A [Beta vulgaris subsp. vulgaris]|nr:hypothetical protein BVRB_3g058320 isoform A [Beta vulgaris subsp. vulgaris]
MNYYELIVIPCSVTIILAYLIKRRGMTVSQALEYVRSKRPQASPNAGFIKQLKNYEQSLLAKECPN